MFNDSNKKHLTVEFTCRALGDDKLSMRKFTGEIGENFIFFRKEFEDIKRRCNWDATISEGIITSSIDLDQLRRALSGQALQEFISRDQPYANLQEAMDDYNYIMQERMLII